MSEPALLNPLTEAINRALRGSFDLVAVAAKTSLVSVAPWAGWPVISTVVDYVIAKISDHFYTFFAEHSTMFVISFQTKLERDSYIEAIEKLRLYQGTDKEHEARQQARQALERLIRFNTKHIP